MAVDDTVTRWLELLAGELELDDLVLTDSDVTTLLDLTRDVAHQIDRPAAPLSTFLVGVAVGRGQPLAGTAARASALALDASTEGA